MPYSLKTFIIALATFLLSGPTLAQYSARDHPAGWHAGGVHEAHATISGTEEKTLVHKKGAGHYSVCNSGSHGLAVSYDESAMDVAPGDCVAVEASRISVKGTDASAHNNASVFNHTHRHPKGGEH